MLTLLDMSPEAIQAAFQQRGLPAFRARQVQEWLLKGAGFDEMTNLPLALRETLKRDFALGGCRIEHKQVSALDGTIKYLFAFSDLNMINTAIPCASPPRLAAGWGALSVPLRWRAGCAT